MGLIEKLEDYKPKQKVVLTAAEKLDKPEEIRQFYEEYVEHLKLYGTSEDIRHNAEFYAKNEIVHATLYYGRDLLEKWIDIIMKY